MAINWSSLTKEEVEDILSTDFSLGLSDRAVIERSKRFKKLFAFQKQLPSFYAIAKVFRKFSVVLLLFTCVMLFFVSSVIDSLLCFGITCLYLVFHVFYYLKFQKTISKNNEFFSDKMTVIRNGREKSVSISDLVVGDVIKLTKNTLIPSNCYIISKENLVLKDEISPSEKVIAPYNRVIEGNCVCAIIDIYNAKDINDLNIDSAEYSFVTNGFFERYSYKISFLIYVFSFALTFLFLILKRGSENSFFVFAVCMAFANGILPAFISFIYKILACELFLNNKNFKNKLFFRNLESIEKLTSLDCVVLNSDMLLSKENPLPFAFYTSGKMVSTQECKLLKSNSFINALVSTEYSTLNIENADKSKAKCLKELFSNDFSSFFSLDSYRLKGKDFPFDTFLFENEAGEKLATVRGDLTSVLQRCSSSLYNNKMISLDDGLKKSFIDAADALISLGCEVVAYAQNQNQDISLDNTHLSHKRLVFLGFVAYSKGMSDKAEAFFELCSKNNIEPIIIYEGSMKEFEFFYSTQKTLSKFSSFDCKKAGEDNLTIKEALSRHNVFLNPNRKQIKAILKIVSENNIKTAYISKQTCEDISTSNFLTVDFLPLQKKKEIEASKEIKKEIYFENSLSAFYSLLNLSFKFKNQTFVVLNFLSFLTIARVITLPFSVFTSGLLISPLQAVFLTFFLDITSIYVLLSCEVSEKNIIKNQNEFNYAFKNLICFLVLPIAILVFSVILKQFSPADFAGISNSLCLFTQILITVFYILFVIKIKFSEKLLVYLISALAFLTLTSMVSLFGNIFGVIADVKILVASLFCALTFLLTYFKIIKK